MISSSKEEVAQELAVNVATLQYWCRQFGSVERRVGKVAASGLEAELQAYKKARRHYQSNASSNAVSRFQKLNRGSCYEILTSELKLNNSPV